MSTRNTSSGKRCFLYADYSQVELRIAADLSQDPGMLEWFRLDLDPHRLTAANLFDVPESQVTKEQRQAGKTINFLIIFDGGPTRLKESLEENGLSFSLEECKNFRAKFFAAHSRYRDHLNEILEMTQRTGAVVSKAGRLRRLPEITYGKWMKWDRREHRSVFSGPPELAAKLLKFPGEQITERELSDRAGKAFAHAKKQAYNFPVQSVGASITKRAVVKLTEMGFCVRSTVHDSIIVEVEAKHAVGLSKVVESAMVSAYPLSVPLKVDMKVLNSLDESDAFLFASEPTFKEVGT